MKRKLHIVIILSLGLVWLVLRNNAVWAASTDTISQYGITWTFDKEYEYGQFVNGDWWVVGPVTVVQITPDGTSGRNGWEVFPSSNAGFSKQPYDDRVANYDSSLMPSLPYTVQPFHSVVKAISVGEGESYPYLLTAAVLTVLDSIPPNDGRTVFRPPYFGTDKPLHSTEKLKVDLLPSLKSVPDTPDLGEIERSFQRVQLDHKGGWTGRAMHPRENMPDYGSSISIRNARGALRLMLDDTLQDKMPALVNYIQMGIDLYGMLQAGMTWPGNGGHGEGRKLPIAFAGVLLDDKEMKDAISTAGEYFFGENNGIEYSENAGRPIYAQVDGSEYMYWKKVCDTSASGSKTYKDPYGYIDGGQRPGSYLFCCLAQPWKGNSLAARLMPELRSVWNDEDFHDFADRWVNVGLWTQPDPVAPCDGNWDNYGITFGPDGKGGFIKDTDPSDGIGRFPDVHATNADGGYYGSAFVNRMWNAYRSSIPDVKPVAIIQASPTEGNAPLTVTFDGSQSYSSNNTIEKYEWDFENDGRVDVYVVTKSHTYPTAGTYTAKLTVCDNEGLTGTATEVITVSATDRLAGEWELSCYNNVFNPAKGERAVIEVEIKKQARIKLGLYNTKGSKIKQLADEEEEAGTHKYYWDGKDDSDNIVGSGLYFVHIQAGDYKKTKKIVVVK